MADEKQLDILYQWTTINHLKLKRGKFWYMAFILIVGAGLVLSFWTSNFLLAIIVMLLALIIIVTYYQPTKELSVVMTDSDFVLDGKDIPYRKIQRFWFRNLGELNYLYLIYKANSLTDKEMNLVLIGDTNPLKIREIFLEKNVEEELEPEDGDVWTNWAHLLKL